MDAFGPKFVTDLDPSKIPPRWAPRCPVCGDRLGREVTLDVLNIGEEVQFRLTCQRRDPDHCCGVGRYYELSAGGGAGETLSHVALKRWADPGKVLGAVAEWLFAFRQIGRGGQS